VYASSRTAPLELLRQHRQRDQKGRDGRRPLRRQGAVQPDRAGGSAFIPGVGPLITAGEGALGGLLKPGRQPRLGPQGRTARAQRLARRAARIRKLGTGILTNGVGSTSRAPSAADSTRPAPSQVALADGHRSGGGGYGDIIDYDAGGNPIYGGIHPEGGSWQDAILGGARKLGSGLLGGQGGGGLGNLAVGGLAGYQALNAANASKRAGQLSDKAIGLAESRWNDAAPLRTAGQARLLNPARPDLTSVYQDTTNPFAVRKLKAG
jgi:hypothetical protein